MKCDAVLKFYFFIYICVVYTLNIVHMVLPIFPRGSSWFSSIANLQTKMRRRLMVMVVMLMVMVVMVILVMVVMVIFIILV